MAAVGLGGLDGEPVWSGPVPDVAAQLVERVRERDARAARDGVAAVPVHVRDGLAGVLVLDGDVPGAASREAVAWVGEALERAQLEASAEVAEQAELRALRAEISPHFVYNSLTTIASFVESDPERARDLMLDFAAYTRHSLARHGDYTTVAGEFAAIEAYLALAKAVHGEKLRVQVRIAPEILPVAVPYLALQPLVENAVRHGVEATGRGGAVVGVIMIAYVLIGGMRGTTWVQIIKAALLIIGGAVMAVWVLAIYGFNFSALLGDAVAKGGEAGAKLLGPGAQYGKSGLTKLDFLSLALALVLGTAGLPHILMRFYNVPSAKEARRSVQWAIGLIGVFYLFTLVLGYGAGALVGPSALSPRSRSRPSWRWLRA